ncbi:MAG: carboxypeptidase-like regulatory domain-containing protein, partial [Planctomycetaceae bacterium]
MIYNEQPVEGATVVFIPTGHKHGATAQTDAEGKFQLRTYEPGDGAVPGNYKVTIRKVEMPAQPEEEESNV